MPMTVTPGMRKYWHNLPGKAVLENLKTTSSGLAESEAKERLAAYGPNLLPEPPRNSALARFLLQFHNILIYVLLASALVTTLLGNLIDTFLILAAVMVNAVIGFVQEGKAEKAIEAIRHMLAPVASVMRGL